MDQIRRKKGAIVSDVLYTILIRSYIGTICDTATTDRGDMQTWRSRASANAYLLRSAPNWKRVGAFVVTVQEAHKRLAEAHEAFLARVNRPAVS